MWTSTTSRIKCARRVTRESCARYAWREYGRNNPLSARRNLKYEMVDYKFPSRVLCRVRIDNDGCSWAVALATQRVETRDYFDKLCRSTCDHDVCWWEQIEVLITYSMFLVRIPTHCINITILIFENIRNTKLCKRIRLQNSYNSFNKCWKIITCSKFSCKIQVRVIC